MEGGGHGVVTLPPFPPDGLVVFRPTWPLLPQGSLGRDVLRKARHSGRRPPNQLGPGVVAGLLSLTAGGCRCASQRHASRDKSRARRAEPRGQSREGRARRAEPGKQKSFTTHSICRFPCRDGVSPVPRRTCVSRLLTSIACSRRWVGIVAPSQCTWSTTTRPGGNGAGSSTPSVAHAV